MGNKKSSLPVYRWEWCRGENIPRNAVCGGTDAGYVDIYVGRAKHMGDLIPGKVIPSHGACYVPYGGAEYARRYYEVLVTDDFTLVWRPGSHGSVPPGAIQGGTCASGEPLYIGRAYHQGALIIGKVHPSHRCLYIGYGGSEHSYTEYKVLVCTRY